MKLFSSKSISLLPGCKARAATIGHYSLGPKNYTATWEDHLFVHEYGHYIQSQEWGSLYVLAIGVPSLISASFNDYLGHMGNFIERQASQKGGKHFMHKYGEYGSNAPGNGIYFDYNIFKSGGTTRYMNPRTGQYDQDPFYINEEMKYKLGFRF